MVQMTGWIMGELIRVFHNTDIATAQSIVDAVAERKIPLIWELDGVKRVLNQKLPFPKQILVLLSRIQGHNTTTRY